jgi:adenine/guanine phosphoribosyltransferase-like PRPP-binding protein
MNHLELTEVFWTDLKTQKWAEGMLHSPQGAINFEDLVWIDLWPLSQLAKLIYHRSRQTGFVTFVDLPAPVLKAGELNKPLCFLVESGFIGFALSVGAKVRYRHEVVDLHVVTNALTDASLEKLVPIGYYAKQYKDKIILPLTLIEEDKDIDRLRARIHDYVENFVQYYDKEIAEAAVVDTFFRELAENAVEHAKPPAFAMARVIRSIWDLAPVAVTHRRIQALRAKGKQPAARSFISRHDNEGFVELVVVDGGPGIHGTLSELDSVPVPDRTVPRIYRWAFRPEVSRLSEDDRLHRGKSPLTGLAECGNRLEQGNALMVIREAVGGCSIERSRRATAMRSISNLDVKELEDPPHLLTSGCNIQLFVAIQARAMAERIHQMVKGPPLGFRFISLLDGTRQPGGTIRNPALLAGRVVEGGNGAPGVCIVDVTGLAADKDTAWHLIRRLQEADIPRDMPTILAGVAPELAGVLFGQLGIFNKQQIEVRDAEAPGWLCLSPRGGVFIIGTDPAAAQSILTQLGNSTYTPATRAEYNYAVNDLRLCLSNRKWRFTTAQLIEAWRAGIGAWILQTALQAQTDSLLIPGATVLPNGNLVDPYLDVRRLLSLAWSKAALVRAIELVLAHEQPRLIVSYSTGVRQICAEIVRRRNINVVHVDLPQPVSTTARRAALSQFKKQRAVIIGDAVFGGGTATRIVRGCLAASLEVTAFVACLDSHLEGVEPKLPVPLIPLVRYPFKSAAGPAVHSVDGFTLCVAPARSELPSPPIRSAEESIRLYGFLRQQKAYIAQHCTGPGGHHFSVEFDFRQFITASALNHLVVHLEKFARGVTTFVFTEESVIGSVATEIVAKLGLSSAAIHFAIASRRVNKEYVFADHDIARLRRVADKGGPVLFVDDAIHSGRVLKGIASLLTGCGIRSIRAWFILDNQPPGAVVPERVRCESRGTADLEVGALFRAFFPAYSSGATCPHCRIGRGLRASIRESTNILITQHLEHRIAQLAPNDVRSLVANPWRYAVSLEYQLTDRAGPLTLPPKVNSPEAYEMAIEELSQFEEGIAILAAEFPRASTEAGLSIARVLADHLAILDKLHLREKYLVDLWRKLDSLPGEHAAALLETCQLWPIDAMGENAERLVRLLMGSIVTADAGIAVLFGLLQRLKDAGIPADIDRARAEFAAVEIETKETVRFGLVAVMAEALALPGRKEYRLADAIILLGRRLKYHRLPHHRVLEDIGQLVGSLRATTVEWILGLNPDPESITYMAIMICLGDIERAIGDLVALGQLKSDDPAVDQVRRRISSVLRFRSRLRQAYFNPSKQNDPALLVEDIRQSLEAVGVLLRSTDPAEGCLALREVINAHFISPATHFQPLLLKWFAEARNPAINVRTNVNPPLADAMPILADSSVLDSMVRSIVSNIRVHNEGKVFVDVDLEWSRVNDERLRLVIRNPTDNPEAAAMAREGRDFRSLALELRKYRGDYAGTVKSGVFETVLEFHSF